MQKWMQQHEKQLHIAVTGLVLLYGVLCFWLYYHQSVAVWEGQEASPYQSDLPLHISMIVEDGWYYSFTAFAYQFLYLLFGKTTIGIALLLAAASCASVYATRELFCFCADCGKDAGSVRMTRNWHSLLAALTLNLVMPIFISRVGEFRYVSYQSANIWHNSTYICMKPVALAAFLMYLKLERTYAEGITGKQWCAFALINILCTGIKPSFLLAFSPVMGVFLLVDLFRGVKLSRILAFGSALLPSGLVILWQNAVLFGQETGNGIAFTPWYTFSMHTAIPKLAVLCSVCFCGLVIALTVKKLATRKQYLFAVCMAALGFLEALCLSEQGTRAVDGNFVWGYSFCLSVLFTVCAVQWLQLKNTGVWRALRIGLGLIYGLHLYCGLYYFLSLVGGASYWMR